MAEYAYFVKKSDYDAALAREAALREELAKAEQDIETLVDADIEAQQRLTAAEQRLTAAEQRNAELVELLRRSTAGDGQDFKQWWNERATLILACLKPTESGASE